MTAPSDALPGSRVELGITSDPGWRLESLSVKDESGNALEVKDNSFIMPTSKMTISAVFETIPFVVKKKKTASLFFAENYKKYQFGSKGVISASKKGIFTAKKIGNVEVTPCEKKDKKWVSASEEPVLIKVEKPSFKQNKLLLSSDSQKPNALDNLTDTTVVPDSWTSSKTTVAEIYAVTGDITVKGNGTTKITAIFGEGKDAAKYSFKIQVK